VLIFARSLPARQGKGVKRSKLACVVANPSLSAKKQTKQGDVDFIDIFLFLHCSHTNLFVGRSDVETK